MRQAMKDRDTAKLSILRSLSARISNADTVDELSTYAVDLRQKAAIIQAYLIA